MASEQGRTLNVEGRREDEHKEKMHKFDKRKICDLNYYTILFSQRRYFSRTSSYRVMTFMMRKVATLCFK